MRPYIQGMTNPQRPRDPSQLAKLIVSIATGEVDDAPKPDGKDPAAVARGRKDGLRGGKARGRTADPKAAISDSEEGGEC